MTDADHDDGDMLPGRASNDFCGHAHQVIQAGTVNWETGPRERERPVSVPKQLPAVPFFVGRSTELRRLSERIGRRDGSFGAVVISAINGAGGIGKTCFSVYWAPERIEEFPDGQIYVNLRGFDPNAKPMTRGEALRSLLDALGVHPGSIPVDLDSQAALYRSIAADKRMLILLDNARDSAHAEPLIPGGESCTVLITSRVQLTTLVALHGADSIALDVLSEHDSRELLARRIGAERIEMEEDAASEILARCDGPPLALSIIAARIIGAPSFPLSVLAEELRELRLDAFDGGEINADLRAVFACSYNAVSGEHAELFRLMGLFHGPDISLAAAANLADVSAVELRTRLRGLVAANLIQEHVPYRYRMHDLLRRYARQLAFESVPEEERSGASRRLVEFYVHTASAADALSHPHRGTGGMDVAAPRFPHVSDGIEAAVAWVDSEHACIFAAHADAVEHGWSRSVWQLAWAVGGYWWRRGHLRDNLAVWKATLEVVEGSDYAHAQAVAHRRLGHALALVGRHQEALVQLENALRMFQRFEDILGIAHTNRAFSYAWEQQGDDVRALEYSRKALGLYRALHDPVWEPRMLNTVGWYCARLGRYAEAEVACEEALKLCRSHGYLEGQANTLDSLGFIAFGFGQSERAVAYYLDAIEIYDGIDNTYYKSETMGRLGEAYKSLGRVDDALWAWGQALILYRTQRRMQRVEKMHGLIAASGTWAERRHPSDRL